MSSSDDSSVTNALSAVSTLIGYIGTEVATTQCFNRIIWPQRSYNNFNWRNAWKAALLLPLGGPLHTAALQTIDALFKNGLIKGAKQGHMLGTCFFPDSGMDYQLYENGAPCGSGLVRNGVWPRVLKDVPLPQLELDPEDDSRGGGGDPRPLEKGIKSVKSGIEIRQRTPVSHLVLRMSPSLDMAQERIVIHQDVGPVTFRTILAIITTEITGVAVAVVVAAVWRSGWMVLWLVPLLLKLLAACFHVPRSPLAFEPVSDEETPKIGSFLLESGQGFQIIEGPIHLVRPFFRHYGHPRRSRWREIIQITVVIAFGVNFPVGLVVSILCMPVPLQCMWTGYMAYVTIALYIARYTHGERWLTTEERLSEALVYAENHPGTATVLFTGPNDSKISVELARTVHNSFSLAKEHAMRIVETTAAVDDDIGTP